MINSNQVTCPVCAQDVPASTINEHLDSNCSNEGVKATLPLKPLRPTQERSKGKSTTSIAPIFQQVRSNPVTPVSSRSGPGSTSRKRPVEDIPSSPVEEMQLKRKKTTMSSRLSAAAPLAERLRPQSLEDFVGQQHLTGPESLLMSLLQSGTTGSLIFWGPPGCGKTTLARLLAKQSDSTFKELSATDSGISDVRAVAEEAKNILTLTGRRTILFLDEVHRFNKAQQDIFLPFIEQGIIQLIGATTENPSFKLTSALVSRCRIFVLERLTNDDIRQIITQAVHRASKLETFGSHTSGEVSNIPSDTVNQPSQSSASNATVEHPFSAFPQLTQTIFDSIISLSTGDARTALSLLELVLSTPPNADPGALLLSLRRSVSTCYDRTGDSRYDMISALHKSVRGSNGNAAMYWLARMLTAGEDPVYIARRMVVCASEDIGLADNHALPLAMAAMQACQNIGMPECRINLAHVVAYLSEAPKSTRAYEAYKRAEEAAKLDPTIPVPMPVRNAPTELMKNLGYSRGYLYNPDFRHPVTNDYMPIQFKGEKFLLPAGDLTGKTWDEEALLRWEVEENCGRLWPGREEEKGDIAR